MTNGTKDTPELLTVDRIRSSTYFKRYRARIRSEIKRMSNDCEAAEAERDAALAELDTAQAFIKITTKLSADIHVEAQARVAELRAILNRVVTEIREAQGDGSAQLTSACCQVDAALSRTGPSPLGKVVDAAQADDWTRGLWSFLLEEYKADPTTGQTVTADIRPYFNQLCELMAALAPLAALDAGEGK